MTDFEILTPSVQAILRDAAGRVLAFDADLADHLSDLASDYAGPYIDPETSRLLSPAYAYQKDAG